MVTPAGAILLGYGGSQHSKIALAWADTLAAQLSRPLHVLLSVLHLSGVADSPQLLRAGRITDELTGLLDSAKAQQTSVTNLLNPPGEALVRESRNAYITVLGARTQGPLKSMVNGSVSQYVARHAASPVVAVREPLTRHTGVIVVGVDGSEKSELALKFAIRHAQDTDGRLLVLHIRHSRDDAADMKVNESIAAAEINGDVSVEVKHVLGSAAEKLAGASSEADLLVVGTRGRSPLTSLMLGSVTQSLLQHSQCPVAVVR